MQLRDRPELSSPVESQLFISCWSLEFHVNRDFVVLHRINHQPENLQMELDSGNFQGVVNKDKGRETVLQDSE